MLIQEVQLNFPKLNIKPSKGFNNLCFGITGVYLIQLYICYV